MSSICFLFQTFSVIWMLLAFFWVIPWLLNFICQRFETVCLFHLQRRVGMKNDWEEWCQGITQKKAHNKYLFCCWMNVLKPYVSPQTLKAIYYAYFHTIMSYGVIFWGLSPDSIKVLLLQKRVIRTMIGCEGRDSCRTPFMNSVFWHYLLTYLLHGAESFLSSWLACS